MNIRDVPERVHAVLARRAAQHGMSLRAYAVSVLADHTALPTMDEWLDDLEQLPEAASEHPAAGALDAARDEADQELASGAGRR
ncbi:MAG: FitA-like ribbon-helix-helix domain-containing protein [Streptosporangiales bacterium]